MSIIIENGKATFVPKDVTIALLPGDGVGPEIIEVSVPIIETAYNRSSGGKMTWEEVVIGQRAQTGEAQTPYPESALNTLRKLKVGYKGPHETPIGKGFRSVNVWARQELDLFANVRPSKTLPGVPSPLKNRDVDLIVVRENTEDLYAGVEFQANTREVESVIKALALNDAKAAKLNYSGTAISIKPITVRATERIVRVALDIARLHTRKTLAVVQKANIMKATDGLFLDVARSVLTNADVEVTEELVDAVAMNLVLSPQKYGVLVMQNLYGDIISDEAAGLVGGPGLAPSGNFGDNGAIFEPVHGSGPKIAGKGIANPTAMILSGAMMLDFLGDYEGAANVRRAIELTFASGIKTEELEGTANTKEFAEAVFGNLN